MKMNLLNSIYYYMYVLLSEFNITIVKITGYSSHLYGSEINNLYIYTICVHK